MPPLAQNNPGAQAFPSTPHPLCPSPSPLTQPGQHPPSAAPGVQYSPAAHCTFAIHPKMPLHLGTWTSLCWHFTITDVALRRNTKIRTLFMVACRLWTAFNRTRNRKLVGAPLQFPFRFYSFLCRKVSSGLLIVCNQTRRDKRQRTPWRILSEIHVALLSPSILQWF